MAEALPLKRKILVFDEPSVVSVVSAFLEEWGYVPVGITKADFIEDAISRHGISLLILAKEMRRKGPSLADLSGQAEITTPAGFLDQLAQLKNTAIDFEFGLNLYGRLRERGVLLPVILTTTDDLNEDDLRYYESGEGRLRAVVVEKPFGTGEALKHAVETCLAGGAL